MKALKLYKNENSQYQVVEETDDNKEVVHLTTTNLTTAFDDFESRIAEVKRRTILEFNNIDIKDYRTEEERAVIDAAADSWFKRIFGW